MEEDYTLLGQSVDQRVGELARRIRTSGNGETSEEVLTELVRFIAESTAEELAAQERRIMIRVFDLLEKVVAGFGAKP